mgnify:CR=1 FL=1
MLGYGVVLAAVCVAVSGPIGFLALAAPQLARRLSRSTGITMVTSLVSAITRRKVRPHLAMTGEITLRGKVLPVGGIKEKILAAKRAGIREIVLCEENRKDVEEINQTYVEGLTFHYVADIMQVIDTALLDEKVKD